MELFCEFMSLIYRREFLRKEMVQYKCEAKNNGVAELFASKNVIYVRDEFY